MPQKPKPNNHPPQKRQKGQAPCNRKSRRAAGIAGTSAGAWNAAGIWFAPAGRSIHIKNLKGSIIMEEKKKHIEIIIDINAAAHTREVQIKAKNVSLKDLVSNYVKAAKDVAEVVEDNSKTSKKLTLQAMAASLVAIADMSDKEET
nr:MAG TPA: hypothetical protein [Caudoviricetes sp.]